MKEIIKRTPILGEVGRRLYRRLRTRPKRPAPFPGTERYWERRYAGGGNSGVGSYALFRAFKADVINEFVAKQKLESVIEFGCGDGNQLRLASYPSYVGFDVSNTAVSQCRKLFESDQQKSFRVMGAYDGEEADVALSLDVIYHLVEDKVFEHYLQTLFRAARRYVIVYSSDSDDNRGYEGTYIRHRNFTKWIEENLPSWEMVRRIPNRYPYRGDYKTGSFADFFIYARN